MALEKVPFQSYRTEEERSKDKRIKITVSLNELDQEIVEGLQEIYDVASPSTLLRIAAHDLHYAIHQRFNSRFIKYLFKKERDRWSYYETLKRQNATQNKGALSGIPDEGA